MCDSQVIRLIPPTLPSLLSNLKDFKVRQYAQAACDTEGTSIILCVCSFLEHNSDPSMKPIWAGKVLMTDVMKKGSGEHAMCVCTISSGSRSLTKFKVDEDSSQIKILDIYVRCLQNTCRSNNGYSYQSKTSNSSKWNILTNCWADRGVSVCPHETAHGRSYESVRTDAHTYTKK